ncbi:MAG: hemerythrin domain-containing protein, partial [Dehalococcoidia bacterium]
MPDALQVLREDHNKVKEMFQRFERSDDRSEKKKIAEEAIMELEVHAQIEEEIFYPAMRKQLGNNELLHEAEEEHHVAKMLMEELQTMRLNDKTFDAKFTVLAENVKHHIGEEEGEMFPKATEAGRAVLDRVGQQLTERKVALMDEMRSAPRKRRAATGSR